MATYYSCKMIKSPTHPLFLHLVDYNLINQFVWQQQQRQFSRNTVLSSNFCPTMASLTTCAPAAATVKGLGGSSLTGTKLILKPSRASFRPTSNRCCYSLINTYSCVLNQYFTPQFVMKCLVEIGDFLIVLVIVGKSWIYAELVLW